MNGGLPPADAFPFATLGGDLAPEPSLSPAAATSAAAAAAAAAAEHVGSTQPSSHPLQTETGSHPLQTERVDITDPDPVAQAQQYCFAPKVGARVWTAQPGAFPPTHQSSSQLHLQAIPKLLRRILLGTFAHPYCLTALPILPHLC
jgi:hypothetical protein